MAVSFQRALPIVIAGWLLAGCNAGHPSPEQIDQVNHLVHDRVAIQWDANRLYEVQCLAIQPPRGELTLRQATEIALARNLSLIANAENLSIAHAQLVQAGLIQNPVIGQSSGFQFPISSGAAPFNFDVNISQELNSLFTQPARVSVARLQEMQANIDLANNAFSIAQEVAGKYQEMIRLRRGLKLQAQLVELYDRAVKAAEARQRVGIVTIPELNRARLELEDARRQVRHFTSQYSRATSEMNWLMGFRGSVAWTLPESAVDDVATVSDPLDGALVEKLGIINRLDLLRADFDRRIGDRNVELARLGLIPNLTVGAEFPRDSNHNWSGGPFFSITLPLFDPGLTNLELIKAQKRFLHKTYEALEGQVHEDVRAAMSNWLIAADDVTFFRDRIIPQQRQNVELMEISFRLGNDDLDALLNVYQSYVQQLQAFEDAVQAYHDARVALQQAVGMTWERVAAAAGIEAADTRPAATRPITARAAPTTANTQPAPDAAEAELNRLFQKFAPTTQGSPDAATIELNRIFEHRSEPSSTAPATAPASGPASPATQETPTP